MLSDKVEGRVISVKCTVRLIPPDGPLGETDAAMAIGKGLINEVFHQLKAVCEGEGFIVDMDVTQVVY